MTVDHVPGLDGGYAWIVAFACFVICFIMAGLSRAAGVLYVAIIDLYGVSREAATTPFSIRFSVRNLSGPLVGLLGQRYGIRAITIAGGILAGIGGALCAFAPDVFWITVFWGGVHGLGYGLCNLIHVLILNQYFEKYKATALGFALSGDCFGTFAFPVILEFLLQNYGVNGTFLILGGIAFNVVPAGLLLKTPDWVKPTLRSESLKDRCNSNNFKSSTGISNASFISDSSTHLAISSKNEREQICLKSYLPFKDNDIFSYSNCNQVRTSTIKESLAKNHQYNNEMTFIRNKANLTNPLVINDLVLKEVTELANAPCLRQSNEILCNCTIPCYALGTVIDNPLLEDKAQHNIIAEYVRNENAVSKLNMNINASLRSAHNPVAIEILPMKCSENVIKEVNQNDLSETNTSAFRQFLITNTRPLFILIAVTLGVYVYLFIAVITIIIDYTVDVGLAADLGKYLIISFSVADLFGRLGFGGVLDKKWIKTSHFTGLSTALMGLFVLAIPLCSNFYYIMACMILYGFVQGGNAIVYPILVGEYMDKKEESVALGCLNLYGGLLLIPLAPMIGFFRDVIGSYDGVFYSVGGLCITAGIMWLLEPCLWRFQQRISNKVR